MACASIGGVLDALLDLILPRVCAACGLPGSDLCAMCARDLVRSARPACLRCGHPWPIEVTTCSECPAHLDHVRHALAYCGPVPALVHAFKDLGRRGIGVLLGDLVADGLPKPDGVLVPVPATPERERARGYNPAAEIARRLSRRWTVPAESVLVRSGVHREQRGASATDRRLHVRGVFSVIVHGPWPVVTIVDDVMTTGATLEACALALRRAGVPRVDAVVAARVCAAGCGPV